MKNPAVAWETLPCIRTGVKTWSHTSKSAVNCTVMDWTNYTLQDEDGYEEANVKGVSGMMVHAWFAWLGEQGGNLKLHLKGAGAPDHDLPFADYFKTDTAPGGAWCVQRNDSIWSAFPCLPFDSAFRAILVGRRPDWYQHTLHLYREGRFSEALTSAEAKAVRAVANAPAGTFPGKDLGNRAHAATVDIAEQAAVVFEAKQGGVIRSLRISPSVLSSEALDAVTIRVTTDGEITAELPLSMFFGGYRGADMQNAKGLPAGFDGKALYGYFPMPFWKAMKIELVGKPSPAMQAVCEVGWSDRNPYPRETTGVFKVQFNDTVAVKAGEPDFVSLEAEGAGILVGCVSKLTGDIEANFSIFTDGSRTPAVETTGGEDYFNHAYGIHPGICGPFSGGLAEQTAYRFHIVDYVPFLNSITFTQDHAQRFCNDRDGLFLSAVFYYHHPRKFLELTDELDVGKPDSEKAHMYRAEGTSERARLQSDTAAYEGYYSAPVTDEGRWTDKGSGFTVTIKPDNDGVRLRRRINQMAYHQEAEVYVDGTLAGTWFDQGANMVLNYDFPKYDAWVKEHFAEQNKEVPSWEKGTMPSKFRDIEFEIPAELTRGKKKLDIKLVAKESLGVTPADTGLINEYHYWVYSYARL